MPEISEDYKKLYHYTNLDGLLGILQNKNLWATQYKFLKDYSELVLMKDKLIEYLFPRMIEKFRKLIKQGNDFQKAIDQKGGLDQFVRDKTKITVDEAYRAIGEDFYIVSFCGEDKDSYVNSNGRLSQWRGYGVGGGIALVFDPYKLKEILKIEIDKYSYEFLSFNSVIYSDDEMKFKRELSPKLDNFAEYTVQYIVFSKQEPPDDTKVFSSFTECISRYKHRGFKEENEVRIVTLPDFHNEEYQRLPKEKGITLKPEKERKFRTKNEKLIPYIELFNSTDIDLPIERIIVGPHKEKESRASVLRMMLRNTKTEITISDIPYID